MQRPSKHLCWKRPKRHVIIPPRACVTSTSRHDPPSSWRKEDTAGFKLLHAGLAYIEGIAVLPRELPKQVALW